MPNSEDNLVNSVSEDYAKLYKNYRQLHLENRILNGHYDELEKEYAVQEEVLSELQINYGKLLRAFNSTNEDTINNADNLAKYHELSQTGKETLEKLDPMKDN